MFTPRAIVICSAIFIVEMVVYVTKVQRPGFPGTVAVIFLLILVAVFLGIFADKLLPRCRA
jgi:hypothetical protein